jgi:hypothetical protein
VSTDSPDPKAELERLRAEVARLQSELGERPAKAPRSRGGWWRPLVSGLCLLLVGVLAPLSIVAMWAHDQVSDTDRYVETVSPLADEPAVQDVIIDRLTTRITELLNIEAVTQEAIDALASRGLPSRAAANLSALTPALAQGVEGFVNDKVRQLVESPEFAAAWDEANRQAHGQMVAVLTGETGGAVEVSGSSVQLNLAVLIDAVKARLVDSGFALASRIPAVSAEFVLFESADLVKAQNGFRLLDATARALPIIALVLLGVAVAVGRRRRRTLMIGALVIAVSMLVLGLTLNAFRNVYLGAIPTDRIPTEAAGVIYDQLVRFIRTNLRALLVLSLVVAAVAWVTGPEPGPASVRQGTSRALGAVRHRRDSVGLDTGPVGRFLHTFRTPIRTVVLGGAVLIYALADHPTGESTLILVLVAGLILLVTELLAQNGEPPTAAALEESSAHQA